MTVVVTGASVAVPGNVKLTELASLRERPAELVDIKGRVPGKGLRYKDRATQLAFCAAYEALVDAGLLTSDGLTVEGEAIAVVASSNFGNVDTVCRVVQTIADEGAARVSPMDLPNASSNVIASSVAIRYGLRGPNLMLCNGATSGLDAVHWATSLITSRRASYALVIGVEPDNEEVRKLAGSTKILDGAAALVLQGKDTTDRPRAELGTYVRTTGLAKTVGRLSDSEPSVVFGPEGMPGAHDLTEVWGVASGALGVLQCVAAVGMFDTGDDGPIHALNGTDSQDATAGIVLRRAVP